MGPTGTIRVVLAEDNALLRQGRARLIESRAGLELAGTAEDLPGLLALDDEIEPDVVVTDIRMPPTGTDEGIRAAAEIRTRRPDAGVVVLSQYAELWGKLRSVNSRTCRRGCES